MSYCVNCGVELNSNEKRCPLCSTPVINPNIDNKQMDLPPYPPRSEFIVERKIKNTTALLISVVLLVPLLVCPLCDYLVTGNISWSLYVIFGIVLGWILIVPPIIMRHDVIIKCAWLDFFSILLFLYLVNMITPTKSDWFDALSLPIVCLLMIMLMIILILCKIFRPRPITIIALTIFMLGLFTVAVDIFTNLFLGKGITAYWSLPAIIACTAITILLLVVSRLAKLKAIIRKKMHI